MNDELQTLKQHFEERGLDDAEAIQLLVSWLGVTCARHSMDAAGLDKRVESMARWIRQNAEHVHVQLHGDRLQ